MSRDACDWLQFSGLDMAQTTFDLETQTRRSIYFLISLGLHKIHYLSRQCVPLSAGH